MAYKQKAESQMFPALAAVTSHTHTYIIPYIFSFFVEDVLTLPQIQMIFCTCEMNNCESIFLTFFPHSTKQCVMVERKGDKCISIF